MFLPIAAADCDVVVRHILLQTIGRHVALAVLICHYTNGAVTASLTTQMYLGFGGAGEAAPQRMNSRASLSISHMSICAIFTDC
jgi:hypothetical protein